MVWLPSNVIPVICLALQPLHSTFHAKTDNSLWNVIHREYRGLGSGWAGAELAKSTAAPLSLKDIKNYTTHANVTNGRRKYKLAFRALIMPNLYSQTSDATTSHLHQLAHRICNVSQSSSMSSYGQSLHSYRIYWGHIQSDSSNRWEC